MLPDDAIELVEKCEQQSLKVFGVAAICLTDEFCLPMMEHDLDLSKAKKNRYTLAKKHLEKFVGSGLFFEVICPMLYPGGPPRPEWWGLTTSEK